MRSIMVGLAGLVMMAGAAAAADCTQQATEKKLAGAALKSFMTKCQNDAKVACTKDSGDKKLAGAAKTSFEKKCIDDAVGKKDDGKKK